MRSRQLWKGGGGGHLQQLQWRINYIGLLRAVQTRSYFALHVCYTILLSNVFSTGRIPLFFPVVRFQLSCSQVYTDKKENQIFLIYTKIQSGAVAKSYTRKGFLIYEEMHKYFTIYEEAVSHIWLCNGPFLNFLIQYMRKILFYFLSV